MAKTATQPKNNGNADAASIVDAPRTTAARSKKVEVEVPMLNIGRLKIKIVGDSQLVSHKWSEKAKKQMLDKQMKKGKQAKPAKDPWADFCESLYWLTPKPKSPKPADIKKAKFGFPAIAFKKAAVGACRQVDGMKMTEARGAFHVEGEYVEIKGTPEMREDMVRLETGTADIRYRGEFKKWSCEIVVRYNALKFSPEQIVNLFNTAGFAVGIGENRPERDGDWGLFHVE